MNLYHLRYFSTLAHIEHYTKAADILAITQPSLSYAISTLEEELGVKLFEKNGRNVTLTKYGKVFLNDVEEVLNRLDSSVNSLKLAGKGEGKEALKVHEQFHHELDSIYRNRIPDERVEWVFSTLSDIYKDLVVYRNELLRRKDQNK